MPPSHPHQHSASPPRSPAVHQAPGTKHQAPSTKHQAPSTGLRAREAKRHGAPSQGGNTRGKKRGRGRWQTSRTGRRVEARDELEHLGELGEGHGAHGAECVPHGGRACTRGWGGRRRGWCSRCGGQRARLRRRWCSRRGGQCVRASFAAWVCEVCASMRSIDADRLQLAHGASRFKFDAAAGTPGLCGRRRR